MGVERREHPRLSKRFDGTWRGTAGATRCSISDISLGGCFVHGLSTPAKGDDTTVTVDFGPHKSMAFAGRVVYTDPGMGFAVRFHPMDAADLRHLGALLDAFRAEMANSA